MRADRAWPAAWAPFSAHKLGKQAGEGLAPASVFEDDRMITSLTTGANTGEVVDAGLHE